MWIGIRKFVVILSLLAIAPVGALVLSSCKGESATHPRVIVIGFDGMDPRMCDRMLAAGELPNLSKLSAASGYKPLGTSIPPQSPVAWATFITGANPGVHGIFDFIHRDPKDQCRPYYSAAETVESKDGWEVGDYRVPLTFWPFNHTPTQTYLRREGIPFWDYLDAQGIPLWFYDIPANYPPSPSKFGNMKCLSGMGTPDLMGSYGTYQFFSRGTRGTVHEGGGIRTSLRFKNNVADAKLLGPENTLVKVQPLPRAETPFKIYRDPQEPLAAIELPTEKIVLREGEWTGWVEVEFVLKMPSFMPDQKVKGICRFYLQQVRPDFKLYCSAINIDPEDPSGQVVTEPPEFIEDIADELQLFSTLGFQEDHKALSNKVFNDDEYLAQATFVLEERLKLLDYALEHYDDGLLFFYFSSTDLQAHMFWWDSDERHPVRDPEAAQKYHEHIRQVYRRADEVVGRIMERYGDKATILVMSDHGFCNFAKQFNINTWLRANGYLYPSDAEALMQASTAPQRLVDWSATRAYGLGLNGLYVNLKGRERDGIVAPEEREALLDELCQKLEQVRDPDTGERVIRKVYKRDEVYSGPYAYRAPDLLIGYYRGYRASWASTLGSIEDEMITYNDSAWSADHCIAAEEVPGVIFANRPILRENPTLQDLAPTILQEFGVTPPDSMTGGNLFVSRPVATADNAGKK